jgi:hypothetical protein
MITLLDRISVEESLYDEEDSFYFLNNLLKDSNWIKYSSNEESLDDVVSAIQTFIMLHASVDIPDKAINKFWTPKPIGTFRYVLTSEFTWASISEYNPVPGYLVQGSYWSNGFYYLVSNQDFLLEANLLVDLRTKEYYNYK